MSYFNKTYKFVKQENFEGFLKVVGYPEEKIEQMLKATPEQKISKDGDNYTLHTTSSAGPVEVKFKSGVQFDDVIGPEKKPVHTIIVVDGNTVTQNVKTPEFTVIFKREFDGDNLVMTATKE